MENKSLLSAKEVIEKLGITEAILQNWQSKSILKNVNPANGKRYFKKLDIDKMLGVEKEEIKEEAQSIHSILDSTAIKSMLYINSISDLPAKYKDLAMKGDLKNSIKHLVSQSKKSDRNAKDNFPLQQTFENLFFALEGLEHENFWWSAIPNIIATDLEQMQNLITQKTKKCCIVIMGGSYNRKNLEVQPDGKVIVFAMNKPSAINILNNYYNTL